MPVVLPGFACSFTNAFKTEIRYYSMLNEKETREVEKLLREGYNEYQVSKKTKISERSVRRIAESLDETFIDQYFKQQQSQPQQQPQQLQI